MATTSAKLVQTTAWRPTLDPRNADAIKIITGPSKIQSRCRALVSISLLMQSLSHVCAQAISTRILPPIYIITRIPLSSFLVSESPSKPQNLTVNFVDQSTVVLSWNQPHNLGGRSDTVYRVVCDACNVGVTYNPPQVQNFFLPFLGRFPHSIDSPPLSPFFHSQHL